MMILGWPHFRKPPYMINVMIFPPNHSAACAGGTVTPDFPTGNPPVSESGKIWMATVVGGDWNMTFDFPYIGNVIIPVDFHIFQRGRLNHQPAKRLILFPKYRALLLYKSGDVPTVFPCQMSDSLELRRSGWKP